MRALVTGATGFLGGYVIRELLQRDIIVTATSTDKSKAEKKDWFPHADYVEHEITGLEQNLFDIFLRPNFMIHLAWSGLPNYSQNFHYEKNLMPQYFFIKNLVSSGLKSVTVSGTCLEYGKQNGPLSADMPSNPEVAYAIAKDTLRKFLQQLQVQIPFNLKWLRLFYIYGAGQSDRSLFSQLERALAAGEKTFNMSQGEQIRDYLPAEEVASNIVDQAIDLEKDGVFNCCSGVPVSVRTMVEDYLKKHNKQIHLNFGHYPYASYEPMAFWGIK